MLPAWIYSILHVGGLLALSGLAYGLVVSDKKKPFNIGFGIASFIVLLGGFGLMARLGYSFKEQTWMTYKLIIWVALSAGVPVLVKRFNLSQRMLLGLISGLLTLAVVIVYTRFI